MTQATKSKSIWRYWPAIVFVGVGWLLATFFSSSNSKAEPAINKPPTQYDPSRVHALGRLEPKGRVIRLVAASGNEGARVEQLLVAEGQQVKSGEEVARMDTYVRRQAEQREAEAQLAVARAKLNQTKAGAKPGDIRAAESAVAMAREQKKLAERDWERATQLISTSNIKREEYDRRRMEFERATHELERFENLLASVREVRAVDLALQSAEVTTAESAVARAQANLDSAVVKSPSAGTILKVHSRAGEKIGDQGLLELGQVSEMQAVAEVFEGDVGKIAVGQSAIVTLDSSREQLRGKVVEIGYVIGRKIVLTNDPVSDTDARVLEVRVAIDPADQAKISRLANARIEVSIDIKPSNKPAVPTPSRLSN